MAIEAVIKEKYPSIKNYIDELDKKWRKHRKIFNDYEAARFFISVMLNQQQKVPRPNCAACNLVYINPILKMRGGDIKAQYRAFWTRIAEMSLKELKKSCVFYDKGCEDCENHGRYHRSYALRNSNKFPVWLKNNAVKILEDYDGTTDNIWTFEDSNNIEDNVNECVRRFAEFDGIGKQLANMATFILARDYGYLGGVKAKPYLKIKRDVHVCRVISKMIFAEEDYLQNSSNVNNAIDFLDVNYDSSADIDWALWNIGYNYCKNDDCENCPMLDCCNFVA